METINDNLMALLQQLGIPDSFIMPVQYLVAIAVIFFVAILVDKIFRRAIIPAIHKVTAKTEYL